MEDRQILYVVLKRFISLYSNIIQTSMISINLKNKCIHTQFTRIWYSSQTQWILKENLFHYSNVLNTISNIALSTEMQIQIRLDKMVNTMVMFNKISLVSTVKLINHKVSIMVIIIHSNRIIYILSKKVLRNNKIIKSNFKI